MMTVQLWVANIWPIAGSEDSTQVICETKEQAEKFVRSFLAVTSEQTVGDETRYYTDIATVRGSVKPAAAMFSLYFADVQNMDEPDSMLMLTCRTEESAREFAQAELRRIAQDVGTDGENYYAKDDRGTLRATAIVYSIQYSTLRG